MKQAPGAGRRGVLHLERLVSMILFLGGLLVGVLLFYSVRNAFVEALSPYRSLRSCAFTLDDLTRELRWAGRIIEPPPGSSSARVRYLDADGAEITIRRTEGNEIRCDYQPLVQRMPRVYGWGIASLTFFQPFPGLLQVRMQGTFPSAPVLFTTIGLRNPR